eukprot:snap_masked-scaffold_53-processed-gene-0.10-mRNA-1 protein AED:1.00 eAED:1.00 QI:0/0/0/0/1/1/2/0/66
MKSRDHDSKRHQRTRLRTRKEDIFKDGTRLIKNKPNFGKNQQLFTRNEEKLTRGAERGKNYFNTSN